MASRAPPRVADRNTGFKKWEVSREKMAVRCVLTLYSLILEYSGASVAMRGGLMNFHGCNTCCKVSLVMR
jgi:hypothetical protein